MDFEGYYYVFSFFLGKAHLTDVDAEMSMLGREGRFFVGGFCFTYVPLFRFDFGLTNQTEEIRP